MLLHVDCSCLGAARGARAAVAETGSASAAVHGDGLSRKRGVAERGGRGWRVVDGQSKSARDKIWPNGLELLLFLDRHLPLSRLPSLSAMSKRSAAASPSKRPAKRPRGIGAPSIDDQSLRLIAARLSAERAGHGSSSLSTRPDPSRNRVRSLLEISLRSAAKGLLEVVQVNKDDQPRAGADGNAKALFGWDPSRRQGAVREGPGPEELEALRDYVKGLPEAVANRLLAVVLESSVEGATASPDGIDIHRLAKLFLHSTTTILSLSALGPTQQLLNKLPDCTSLADLDLSSHTTLSDNTLKQILPKLSQLRRIVLRGCTKVGDGSVVALSRATEHRLKDVNLSMTAVTIKGLTSLLARCSALEVLKLANVPGLVSPRVASLRRPRLTGILPPPERKKHHKTCRRIYL